MVTQSKRVRIYEPWGYQEENNYQSDENILLGYLDSFFAEVEYSTDDKKIHFYNKDGEEKASLDVSGFSSSVVESTNYDTETKILTIKFSNGDVVEINLAELIDENEFGDGLQVIDGIVSVLVDGTSDPYLSVGEDGIKLHGVDTAIDAERERAISAETELQSAIDDIEGDFETAITTERERAISAETALNTAIINEISRAQDAESSLDVKITNEITRATSAETVLNTAISNEITRATQTEQHLNSRIDLVNDELDAEESIREANDVRLENKIDGEIARATSAETDINNSIDELSEKLQPLLNDTLVKLNPNESAVGQYNISRTGESDADKTVFTIGVGTSDTDRKNALEVRQDGTVFMWVEGDFLNINDLLSMLAHETY